MGQRGRTTHNKRTKPTLSSAPPPLRHPNRIKRHLTQGLAVLILAALLITIVVTSQSRDPLVNEPDPQHTLVPIDFQGDRNTWQLLALPDEELEKVSLVELNLAVVREIEGYEGLDLAKYETFVDQWAREFAKELPKIDATFRGREAEYKNDLRFYRIGQLMAWLGHKKNIAYIPEQRDLDHVTYKDPAELFLHGLLDTRLGTCGNMPTLQAAIARRLGWPVALAPIESHTVCRYDDGEVAYNIETTHTDKGGFSAGTEQDYAKEFKLPDCAFTEADTLQTMSAREMLAYFISLRGRYYWDTGQWEKADQDHALARSLLPKHRRLLLASMELSIQRSSQLFDAREARHPVALYAQARDAHKRQKAKRSDPFDVDRINAENRRRMQQEHARVMALNEQNRRRLQNQDGFQQQPYDWNQPTGYQQPQTHDPYSPSSPPPQY